VLALWAAGHGQQQRAKHRYQPGGNSGLVLQAVEQGTTTVNVGMCEHKTETLHDFTKSNATH
jgi:hypothetical protein